MCRCLYHSLPTSNRIDPGYCCIAQGPKASKPSVHVSIIFAYIKLILVIVELPKVPRKVNKCRHLYHFLPTSVRVTAQGPKASKPSVGVSIILFLLQIGLILVIVVLLKDPRQVNQVNVSLSFFTNIK
jgi:hypothetical protein